MFQTTVEPPLSNHPWGTGKWLLYRGSLQCRHFLWVCECFCSQKRHLETPEERRKWDESKEVGEGVEREKRKHFFVPSPPPFLVLP